MGFERPTLPELVARTQQDLISGLRLSGSVLRRSMVVVLSRVVAGAVHMLHGHLEYLSRQVFPDRSEAEFLERQAGLFGIARKPAAFARGIVAAEGEDGTVIPAGSVLRRSDGTTYETELEVAVVDGAARPSVVAATAGSAGNADAGTALVFESPVPGLDYRATVAAGGLSGGADPESDSSLRGRLLERLRRPPHGGAAADYVAWALEVPGVTRAWVYPLERGAGTVVVRFVRDDDPSIIPDATEVAAVQAYIDERRPVTAAATVLAPVAKMVQLTIATTPRTEEVRQAVKAEAADFLRREARPGATLRISKLRMALAAAEGLEDFDLQAPLADIVCEPGELVTFGYVWL